MSNVRRKHKSARAWAFVVLFLVLAFIGTGVFFLIRTLGGFSGNSSEGKENVVKADDNSSTGDFFIEEDDVVVDIPEYVDEGPDDMEIFEEYLRGKIAGMTLEEKVLGLFIVRPEQITGVDTVVQAGDGTRAALEQYPVGGIIYGEKNIVSADQFSQMLSNTRNYCKYPIFLMVTEETGNTVVGNKLGLTATRTQAQIGETKDPYQAYVDHKVIADYLKGLGIDFNIGVVADVLANDETADAYYMNNRCFGNDTVIVSRMVYEGVNAYKENDMLVALGYFPGQGSLTSDPEFQVSAIVATGEEISGMYQEMYKNALDNGGSAIVVSHEYASALTSDNMPCSLSKDIYTTLLREQFGFYDTVLITDCLDKASITEYYTSSESCVKALKAGADMLMCPENFEEGYRAVLDAVASNVISEARIDDALLRVFKLKYRNDYDSVVADYSPADLSDGE